eukprot:6962873-Alexandrium_andersonii.AAC.1
MQGFGQNSGAYNNRGRGAWVFRCTRGPWNRNGAPCPARTIHPLPGRTRRQQASAGRQPGPARSAGHPQTR